MLSLDCLPLIAIWLATLHVVFGNDPNTGFAATIDTASVQIYPTNDYPNFTGSAIVDYTFAVPVEIARRGSSEDFITLRVFTRLFDYDESSDSQELEVYQEDIFLNEVTDYNATAYFNVTTNSTTPVTYYLSARIDINLNSDLFGDTTAYQETSSAGAVVEYNPDGGWTASLPSIYVHAINVAVHTEYDAEVASAAEEPIDTTSETVIDDQDPDLPTDEDPIVTFPNPPTEDGTPTKPGDNTTSTSCSSWETPTACSCGKDKHTTTTSYSQRNPPSSSPCSKDKYKPSSPPSQWHQPSSAPWEGHESEHCRDFHSWKRNNWKNHESAHPSPVPSDACPPPPCPTDDHKKVYKRQNPGERAVLRLNLTFGPSASPQPVRQTRVTAYGLVNDRIPLIAYGKTNNRGIINLRFPVSAGTVVQVTRITASMDQEAFRVSSSDDNGETFLYWYLRSIPLAWEVPVGSTDFSYRFMNKATNDILNVQDRMLTYWIFAKTKVAKFSTKLPNVWFPGQITKYSNNYFRDPSAYDGPLSDAFINIHPDKSTATTPQAHEYGHWFHYLVRKRQAIVYDLETGQHSFCQKKDATSATVALTEGYATAFGLSALWRSKYQQLVGTAYCFFPCVGANPARVEIERYNCTDGEAAEDLSFDEGRVASVMRDLIDSGVDNSGGDAGLGRSGLTDNANIVRSRVLWSAMRNNPSNMEDYWQGFKTSPGVTQAEIDAAWTVFEYGYAQFSK